ncbi:MAG: flagellar protein FlaG [Pseudomonadota bacterium]
MNSINLNGSSAVQTSFREPAELQVQTRPDVVPLSSVSVKTATLLSGGKTTEPPAKEKNIEQTKAMVDELNAYMDDLQTNLGFSIHEELGNQVVVEIKNRQTDELVRQIPSEALQKIKEKMIELTGLFFDEHA